MKRSDSQVRARSIMGNNYFGIDHAAEYLRMQPQTGHHTALSEVPFSEKELEQCKDDHILVAVLPISIMDLIQHFPTMFDFPNLPWYRKEGYANHPGRAQWQLLRSSIAPGTLNRRWNEQRLLIGRNYEVPPVRVMAYFIIGHYFATGDLLFPNVSLLTSSVDSDDDRAGIGVIDKHLVLSGFPDAAFGGDISIASARKSNYS
jgi:hypothetical protein